MPYQHVVMDTTAAVNQALTTLAQLDDTDYEIDDIIDQAFWCLESLHDRHHRLEEWSESIRLEYGRERSVNGSLDGAAIVDIYCRAMYELTEFLYERCTFFNLFDDRGALLYRYDKRLGSGRDIVLVRYEGGGSVA